MTDQVGSMHICVFFFFFFVFESLLGTLISAPASPLWRSGLPLLPSPAIPLPFLSCCLSYSNSRHKPLCFDENFMGIRPKLKKLSMFKCQFYVYSIFEVFIVKWVCNMS